MASLSFSSVVAARTRAADHIRSSPELLEAYMALGGLRRDLDVIVESGQRAEAANLGQSSVAGAAQAATATVVERFAALQREYKAVMAVVRAVRQDLVEAGLPQELIGHVDQVLADETAVHVKTVKGEGDTAVKRALKRASQEAIRAEIRKDAAALLATPGVAEALAARKVDLARLTKLRDDADALAGTLASRVAKKAERKAATAGENDAVRLQRRKWSAFYRILAAIPDERAQALVKAASSRA